MRRAAQRALYWLRSADAPRVVLGYLLVVAVMTLADAKHYELWVKLPMAVAAWIVWDGFVWPRVMRIWRSLKRA